MTDVTNDVGPHGSETATAAHKGGRLLPRCEVGIAQTSVKSEDTVFAHAHNSFFDCGAVASKAYSMKSLSTVREVSDSAADLASPDVAFAEAKVGGPDAEYGLFAVFDGHNGAAAAQFAVNEIAKAVQERLPYGAVPPETDHARHRRWREQLQTALAAAMVDVDNNFACLGQTAGCTATVMLQYHWLITVASVGDSRASVDCGGGVMQLSVDHRIATNKIERKRLEDLGCVIAPIDASGDGPAVDGAKPGWGPLRVWPGGLCLSRALGDFDVGPSVIPLPHVYQVEVPKTGGRIMLASDGCWDAFDKTSRVAKASRNWAADVCPRRLITLVRQTYGTLRDDISIIVLDVLPDQRQWPDLVKSLKPTASTGCFGGCFGSSSGQSEEKHSVKTFADVDLAVVAGLMPDSAGLHTNNPLHPIVAEMAALHATSSALWSAACEARLKDGRIPSRENLMSALTGEMATTSGAPNMPPDISVRVGGGPTAIRQALARLQDLTTVSPPSTPMTRAQADASQRFQGSVAATPDSYAEQFGHYGREGLAKTSGSANFARKSVDQAAREWDNEVHGGSPKGGVGHALKSALTKTSPRTATQAPNMLSSHNPHAHKAELWGEERMHQPWRQDAMEDFSVRAGSQHENVPSDTQRGNLTAGGRPVQAVPGVSEQHLQPASPDTVHSKQMKMPTQWRDDSAHDSRIPSA
ncbi:hypothetical protein WJX74_006737 [Apatococcus lobatus]|uniref:PPM-type phosphatase domain-containing protein n=2 Tax=Apatococcus TaxID=904362 RepID=A0AAW1TE11_9CHLO